MGAREALRRMEGWNKELQQCWCIKKVVVTVNHRSRHMRILTVIVSILLAAAGSCLAQSRLALDFPIGPDPFLGLGSDQNLPVLQIYPEDVVMGSVMKLRLSSDGISNNFFVVRWTFTDAGAKKMLAFRESHQNQKMRMVIGRFESPPEVEQRVDADYQQWKEGWLKHRTDKMFTRCENEQEAIYDGLEGK
jgi:hypothetical protein